MITCTVKTREPKMKAQLTLLELKFLVAFWTLAVASFMKLQMVPERELGFEYFFTQVALKCLSISSMLLLM